MFKICHGRCRKKRTFKDGAVAAYKSERRMHHIGNGWSSTEWAFGHVAMARCQPNRRVQCVGALSCEILGTYGCGRMVGIKRETKIVYFFYTYSGDGRCGM